MLLLTETKRVLAVLSWIHLPIINLDLRSDRRLVTASYYPTKPGFFKLTLDFASHGVTRARVLLTGHIYPERFLDHASSLCQDNVHDNIIFIHRLVLDIVAALLNIFQLAVLILLLVRAS